MSCIFWIIIYYVTSCHGTIAKSNITMSLSGSHEYHTRSKETVNAD